MVARVTTIEGIRRKATSDPFTVASSTPMAQVASTTIGIGTPAFASTPELTAQTANSDPTEMSMWPVRITSVIPSPMISTGTLARHRSIRLSRAKKPGDTTASTTPSAATAPATDASRLPTPRMSVQGGLRERQRQDGRLGRLRAMQHAAHGAAVHHRDPIAHAEDFGKLRRDHDDGEAAGDQHLHQRVYLRL